MEHMNLYLFDMSNNKHIWEGWTVQNFIDELEVAYKFQQFSSKADIKKWCMSEQPYYKKYIPEVVTHFINKWKGKI